MLKARFFGVLAGSLIFGLPTVASIAGSVVDAQGLGHVYADAQGLEEDLRDVHDVIADAATVARVRITDRHPIYIFNSNKVCGYAYTAHVVEAFKGSTPTVQFFSDIPEDFPSLNDDYLVFTFPATLSRYSDVYEKSGQQKCPGAPEQFTLSTTYDFAYEFDRRAAKLLGGSWVRRVARISLTWCDFPHAGTCQVREAQAPAESGTEYPVENWDDIKVVIRAALATH